METALTPDEIGERAEATYSSQLKDKVETKHFGKFLALDVESGDYEIDADDMTAEDRLLPRRPDAVMFLMRIGFPAAHFVGMWLPE